MIARALIVSFSLIILALVLASTAVAKSSPDDVTVVLKNYEFAPLALTVPLGTTVTWVNDDGVFHTATSAWDAGASFDHSLEDGQQGSWTFATAGTFVVRCLPHSNEDGEGGWMGMVQTITVEPAVGGEAEGGAIENRVSTMPVLGLIVLLVGVALARAR